MESGSTPMAPSEQLYKDNRSPDVVAASIALLIIPTIAVVIRIISRWTARAGFWWDDYTIIIAMFLAWGPNISNIDSARHGLGKHFVVLAHPPNPFAPLYTFFKHTYAFVIMYILAITAAKFSIIFFMWRIFPIVHFRRFLLACHVFVASLGVAALLVAILQCIPIHDFWDTLAGRLGGKCINVFRFYITTGSLNAVFNFVLLALPIPLLWKLRTSKLQKFILTIIFIISLTPCAIGLVHVIVISNLHTDDLTWNYVDAAIWTAAETSVAITCACLPSFRPLFVRLIWGKAYRPTHVPHSSQRSFSKSWLSGSHDVESSPSRGFNRLHGSDSSMYGLHRPWMHNVAVSGGNEGQGDQYAMHQGGSVNHFGLPKEGIQVRTTITVTERVDWQDDLF